jgi:hypothetical protein
MALLIAPFEYAAAIPEEVLPVAPEVAPEPTVLPR